MHQPGATTTAPASTTGLGGSQGPITAAGPGMEAVRAEHDSVQRTPTAAAVPDRVLSGPHFTEADVQREQDEGRVWHQQREYQELQELEHDMREQHQHMQEEDVPISPTAAASGIAAGGVGGGGFGEYEERREPSFGGMDAPALASATASVEAEQFPPPAVAHAQGMTTPSDTFAFKVLSEGGGVGPGVGSPPMTPRAAGEPMGVGAGAGIGVDSPPLTPRAGAGPTGLGSDMRPAAPEVVPASFEVGDVGSGVDIPSLSPRAAGVSAGGGVEGGEEEVAPEAVPAIFEPMPGSKEPGHRLEGKLCNGGWKWGLTGGMQCMATSASCLSLCLLCCCWDNKSSS